MICDNCGHFNDKDLKLCERCGYELIDEKEEIAELKFNPVFEEVVNELEEEQTTEDIKNPEEKICALCKKKIEEGLEFCVFCQNTVEMEDINEDEAKETIASEKPTTNNIFMYITATIITILICAGLIVFMMFAAYIAKNENYEIKEEWPNHKRTQYLNDEESYVEETITELTE